MVLMGISSRDLVGRLRRGEKVTTTRAEGKRDIRPGATLHFYFRSRLKKSCYNCVADCAYTDSERDDRKKHVCNCHNSFILAATCIKVYTIKVTEMSNQERETWALKDGFDSFQDAAAWFSGAYGPEWMGLPWVVYEWEHEACKECQT